MKNILIIASGPSVIGQGAEFDYSGTQAAIALRELGHKIVVINSNPASILTDQDIADSVYIEDINLDNIVSIIKRENIDSVLGNFGGQTALNMVLEMHDHDIFEKYNLDLLANSIETIRRAEDREEFRDLLKSIDEPFIDSVIVNSEEEAMSALDVLDFPLIIRPAYTLGGTGGGRVNNLEDYRSIVKQGLQLSLVHQCLIEKDLSGIKELEFEMIRDHDGDILAVCSLENFDPVGVHTGDSIVFAPVQSLDAKIVNRLENSAKKIVTELGIIGSCNVQFAYDEDLDQHYVIEVNPRVSRSSALASKVSNYPIAKVSALIASGLSLEEIDQKHEPISDYVACKMPRFPFDKFKDGNRRLGTQMKSTGEIMAFASSLQECIYKGILSLEFSSDHFKEKTNAELLKNIEVASDLRIYEIIELLERAVPVEELAVRSKIDLIYLEAMENMLVNQAEYEQADFYMHALNKNTFYSSLKASNLKINKNKDSVLVIGSGPIRIGQGMEFDYSSVQAILAIQEMGYDAVMVNNNPATVSTDDFIADRLYFEPLTIDRLMKIIEFEKPIGVMVQFGGQTAINLAQKLSERGVNILGTSLENMNRAEDRELFEKCLRKLNIRQAEAYLAHDACEYMSFMDVLDYPVLIRPSFVIGGASMKIIKNKDDYRNELSSLSFRSPVLIDRYISGIELDLDLISDGHNILIPGLMEHIEKSGVHSGDSMAVYPSQSISKQIKREIEEIARTLARELKIVGLMNMQMIVSGDDIYVIELNPRASRTVPFISKASNYDLSKKAARIILGEKLDQDYGLLEESSLVHIKAPIFSFSKLRSVDTFLSPEMKSTGEVMASDQSLNKALYKAFLSSSYKFKKGRYVLLTIADKDKDDLVNLARKIEDLDYDILASENTYEFLRNNGIKSRKIPKIGESEQDMIWAMEHLDIDFIVNTVSNESKSFSDGFIIRRNAVERGLPLFTSIDTARALVTVLESRMIKPLKLGGK
ncbi:MAG: ATP-grasp domain-containing protein [Erysipelothrix sp.]|nr:ATP-grasp domain-containing protein [Erysipelothrix sp.]